MAGPHRQAAGASSTRPARDHPPHGLSLLTVLLLLAQGLQAGASPRPAAAASAPSALAQGQEAPPPSPSDREPVDAPVDINGVVDPPIEEPQFGTAATPQGVFQDEVSEPQSGGVTMDVYAPEPGVGGHLAALSGEIFNTEDATGRWMDAALSPDDYGWSLGIAGFSIRFPARLGPATPVVYQISPFAVSSTPTGVDGAPGVAEGTVVRYDGALPGTDYVYEVTAEGYKERVVLRQRPSSSLSWDLSLQGLSLIQETNGEIGVVASGVRVASLPAPFATDSSDPPVTSLATYRLTSTGQGSYRVAIELDPAFLDGAVYPIVVDPGTVQPTAQSDTYVDASQPAQSHGSLTTLKTGPGGRVLGREITIEARGVRTRPDLFVELPNGQQVFIEVKTGASAALTSNQATAFLQIWSQGGIPRGANAAAAGLTPGLAIGPTPVWVVYQPWPLWGPL